MCLQLCLLFAIASQVRAVRKEYCRQTISRRRPWSGLRNSAGARRQIARHDQRHLEHQPSGRETHSAQRRGVAVKRPKSKGLRWWVIRLTTFVLLNSAPTEAAPKRAEPAARLEKRGPRAWDNYDSESASSLAETGVTRLLVHAVADASLAQWLPKVRDALAYAQAHSLPVNTPEEKDLWIAVYFDYLCYAMQRHPSAGSLVLFGLLCLLPELKGRMPRAARSLKSWTKLAVVSEGGPIPEEMVFLIGCEMIAQGHVIEGVWTLVQYDIYGREQDISQLQTDDLHCDGTQMALDLGVRSRGESTKTGANHGVVVRRGWVVALLVGMQRWATHCQQTKLFPISQEIFRRSWHKTCRRLAIEFAGSPHNIRHSGPSEDLSRQRSTLENVRRRGRWKVMESVQRYTKTFSLTRFRSKLPEVTTVRAKLVEKDVVSALFQALRTKKAQSSPHG
ncbi:unnamed protein product [Polarella glacialis]|uniref:Uncharacterized protein n=1 Tax=Polarella glacialis TaxID=89957 RepID=A0A813DJ33_POLGL|nr:unnamed protein product [Polarella glacialis]